jgi:hypothetical protein
MKKEAINSAYFKDGKLFVNNKEVTEDIGEWMYRIRISSESLVIKKENERG